MEKEKHYYIRGNEKGKAVIDKLISMGGKNCLLYTSDAADD